MLPPTLPPPYVWAPPLQSRPAHRWSWSTITLAAAASSVVAATIAAITATVVSHRANTRPVPAVTVTITAPPSVPAESAPVRPAGEVRDPGRPPAPDSR